MRSMRCAPLLVVLLLGVVLVPASPAWAVTSVTVNPHADLLDSQVVTVEGAGFDPLVDVALCQAVRDDTPGQDDCATFSGALQFAVSSETGEFTTEYDVRQSIFVPSLGRVVDCWVEECVIGAAEINDIAGTATFAPLTFKRLQPDSRVVRRSDNTIFHNDVYVSSGAPQTTVHPVTPDHGWFFVLQAQNDGEVTDDIRVNATSLLSSSGVTVRYFAGYFDITSSVTGSGFTFADVPAGGIRQFRVLFSASSSAAIDDRSHQLVVFTSETAPIIDNVRVGVRVVAPT